MELLKPTTPLARSYGDKFEAAFGQSENAIRLVCEKFPGNRSFESVLVKSIVINTLYATQIRAIIPVAQHIVGLKIDDRLLQGDPTLVDDIAVLTVKGKTRRNYSFATKYCSFHNPPAYPIYDGFVDRLLNEYQKLQRFSSFPLGDLKDYRRFKEVLHEFIAFYGLNDLNAKELDLFLWGYGRELFA